jgi:hypothetical protein
MKKETIVQKPITFKRLKDFYEFMDMTHALKTDTISRLYASHSPRDSDITALKNARDSLRSLPSEQKGYRLTLDSAKTIQIDLSYEITELEKDIAFLGGTDDTFLEYLAGVHTDFSLQVERVVDTLRETSFNCFFTDRDGTVNNYCGRYLSSIQSIYNAVFLGSFARYKTKNACILTSAPLRNRGMVDISLPMHNAFVLAGSKGREYVDRSGTYGAFDIDPVEQEKLSVLNDSLRRLLARPEYEKFGLIGSGLQLKFGQTTIARQDISHTIGEKQSTHFLRTVESIVHDIDPREQFFRIEDTGLDIEILLTVRQDTDESALKDFDKGDGIAFLNSRLNMSMETGITLVCGDTKSDIRMCAISFERNPDTRTVFVTSDPQLQRMVSERVPDPLFVSSPDILVTALYLLSKN